jgi:hypothetical protein
LLSILFIYICFIVFPFVCFISFHSLHIYIFVYVMFLFSFFKNFYVCVCVFSSSFPSQICFYFLMVIIVIYN